jgi:hypothetical protein
MICSRVKFSFIRHTLDTPALKKTIVNLSDKPLDNALHFILWKWLNYAVALTVAHSGYPYWGEDNCEAATC